MRTLWPPGPRGYPILGVLPQLRSDPIRTFLDAADRYGDLVHLKAGPYHGFLLSDPAHIKHVLQDNARNYHKSPLYDRLRDGLGNGLLTSEDSFWLRQRRLAQPAFHRQRLIDDGGCDGRLHGADARALGPHGVARRNDRRGRGNDGPDAGASSCGRCSAPTSARRPRSSTARGRSSIGASVRRSGRRSWRRRCRCPANRRFQRALRELEAVVYRIIADRRQAGRDEAGPAVHVSFGTRRRDRSRNDRPAASR